MAEDTTTTQRSQSGKSNGKWKAAAQATGLDSVSSDMNGIQDQIMDGAKKAYDTVVDKASDAFEGFNANPTTYIRQYPVQAAIGGMVIGMLLGAAISRRSLVR